MLRTISRSYRSFEDARSVVLRLSEAGTPAGMFQPLQSVNLGVRAVGGGFDRRVVRER